MIDSILHFSFNEDDRRMKLVRATSRFIQTLYSLTLHSIPI